MGEVTPRTNFEFDVCAKGPISLRLRRRGSKRRRVGHLEKDIGLDSL